MLSVLIPTYNYDITALVNAVHRQCTGAGVAFEIIVIDDRSQPAYTARNRNISALMHCTYIESGTNLGRTLSRKKLAETARYETLLFLDADVVPVKNDFIVKYLPFFGYNGIVFGGYSYRSDDFSQHNVLRHKYGTYREEKIASERSKTPYSTIFSGNILVNKNIFLDNNYPDGAHLYGMDNFFAYSLYKNNVAVNHIDNPIYHLGLESNEVFFEKCLESVRNRKKLLAEAQGIEEINSLLKHYKKLKGLGLAPLTGLFFKMVEPFLKKMILKKDPNLFCLDIYRLGYICAIK
ncbi:glycosyltransferase family 2 protein [Flavobacterium sp.]|uniref:glycosyltransferase family 2 protein n=1 Tax=Flavobacterium sp. TaxID=239 RepID=UPI004033446B